MVRVPARALAAALLVALCLLASPAAARATTVCSPTDSRLDEVSGMAVLPGGGYVVMNDGKPGTTVMRLYVLDGHCRIARIITDRSYDPFDTEDLARTPDGTLWIGDIGDNDHERKAPAVLVLPPGSTSGTKYQLAYPIAPSDAETLLIQPDRRAVVVTKTVTGVSDVLISSRPLTGPAATIPMLAAGTVSIAATNTLGGPVSGGISSVLVTGGAVTADRSRIAIRTYTDAFEFDVTGGDFAAALTTGEPRRTPIPGERQGESLAYSLDGSEFVTTSEGVGSAIQTWTPAPRTTRTPSASPPASATTGAPGRGNPDGVSWPAVVIGAVSAVVFGIAGVAALVAGRRAIRRMRRRHR
ncbi:MAG: hypothetical protein QOI35_3767 [Cryptosporangiaceae bacterium]|nr:hypothetical protein [Cryptosporangiaceae bacterium]